MDQQPAPQKGIAKPLGGFIVVMVVATIVGGWLYVDMVRHELESKVDAVSADLAAVRAARQAESQRQAAPPEAPKMKTYAAALGEHRFQVDVPEGWHLSVGDGSESAVIVMDATAENGTPVPDASIRLVDLTKEPYASRLDMHEPRMRLVPTADGKAGFLIAVWEDFEWPEFDRVAASFKAL